MKTQESAHPYQNRNSHSQAPQFNEDPQTYEAVAWVVGKELFKGICAQYQDSAATIPFSEFLKGHRLTRSIPFLAELARFEWNYQDLQHRPNPHPLTTQTLEKILNAHDCRLQFIDAMEIFVSPFRVSEMWLRKSEPPTVFEEIVWEYPEWVLMFKHDDEIFLQHINSTEASILNELRGGAKVSDTLLKHAAILHPERIGQIFELLIQSGIIEDMVLES